MIEIDMSAAVTPSSPILAEHARAIHELAKRTREDIIAIGRHLAEARDQVAHGAWLAWIEAEFGWSDQTARNFIHVYEFSRDPKSKPVLDLDLPLVVLYRIAAPKAEAARQEITERIEAGEQVFQAQVVEAIAGHRIKGVRSKQESPPIATGNGADPTASAAARAAVYAAQETDESDPTPAAAGDDHASAPGEPAPDPVVSTSAEPAPDPAATAAAAVNQLSPTELQSFLDQLSPAHKRAFEQHFGRRDSNNPHPEIAKLARESRALLTHAQQNADDIRSRLTRIIRLTGLDGKTRREAAAKSNVQLDRGAFTRGMGLASPTKWKSRMKTTALFLARSSTTRSSNTARTLRTSSVSTSLMTSMQTAT
jgi:hypothetical protein